MKRYFIPHRLQSGDIVHLSDEDSEIIIENNLHDLEDLIEISNLEKIFLATITNIQKASVEVEIIKELKNSDIQQNNFHITLIQSLSDDSKFTFLLEKAVEIGIHRIIPIESQYSSQSKKRCGKKYNTWRKIVQDAREQSRNSFPVDLEHPIRLKDLKDIHSKHRICLSTEVTTTKTLENTLKKKDEKNSYAIAIGPEKGWSSSDLKVFENLNFEFSRLGKNILRTETGGLVIASILNFRAGLY
jgi:16S rRNA (uracil1498-N3)-methyltransferase